jgi:hypothetical protein
MVKFYIIFCFLTFNVFAQTEFEVTTKVELYEDLENPISLTNGQVWDDPSLEIPLGFNFEISTHVFNTVYIPDYFESSTLTIDPSGSNVSPIFAATTLDYIDRGFNSGISESDISYKLDQGDEGKILKIQWSNVGFFDDQTLEDFMNVQIWFYENSNKIEYRYGPVKIDNTSEVYFGLSGTTVAIAASYDLFNDAPLDNTYFLTEDPSDPSVIKILPSQFLDEPLVLDGTILENTVYEFNNTTLSLSQFGNLEFQLYPNPAVDIVNIKTNLSYFKLEVFNLLGQKLISSSNQKQIDVSSFSKGIYLFKISSNKEVVTKKIVIE